MRVISSGSAERIKREWSKKKLSFGVFISAEGVVIFTKEVVTGAKEVQRESNTSKEETV